MRIIGRPRALLAVLAASLLLAGCGSGPGRMNTAVITGGETVSVDEIQSRVDKVLASSDFARTLAQQHKLDLLSREILTREVLYQATEKAAQREGLRVDEKELAGMVAQREAAKAALAQQIGQDGIEAQLGLAADAAFDTTQVVRNEVLQGELGAKYLQRLAVTFEGALIDSGDTRTVAKKLAAQLAAEPANAQQVIAASGQDGARPLNNETLSLVSGLLVSRNQEFELSSSALFSSAPGTVVAFPLSSQSMGQAAEGGASTAWVVGLITNRNENAALTEKEAQIVPEIPEGLLSKIGRRLVSRVVPELNVQVSPRYGVWDPIGNKVAPRAEETVGYLYPARAAQP